MKSLTRHLGHPWLAICVFFAVLVVASTAWAAGRIQWTKTRVKENVAGTQSNWNLEMAVFMPTAPDVAHVPVKFEFKQTVYYERYLTDDSPQVQVRRVPTPTAQDIIESVELGFLDPGTGKIENRTKFAFKVTRAHGFEAGEYRVVVKDARTGATIGTPTTLILEGENEVIDRRAMVIQEKKKVEDDKKDEAAEAPEEAEEPVEDESSWEDVGQQEDEALPPPEPIKKKGACACSTPGDGGPSGAAFALPLLLGLGIVARRRLRRAA